MIKLAMNHALKILVMNTIVLTLALSSQTANAYSVRKADDDVTAFISACYVEGNTIARIDNRDSINGFFHFAMADISGDGMRKKIKDAVGQEVSRRNAYRAVYDTFCNNGLRLFWREELSTHNRSRSYPL